MKLPTHDTHKQARQVAGNNSWFGLPADMDSWSTFASSFGPLQDISVIGFVPHSAELDPLIKFTKKDI